MKSARFTLRGFKRPREAVNFALGSLEREVMEEIWKLREASVRDLHGAFGERAAYTTLMTTLDRLYRKRLLNRRKDSRAYIYSPRVSQTEFHRIVAKEIIDSLLGRDAEPVLACIVEAVGERDSDLLNELDRLLKEKRQDLVGKKKS